MFNSRGLGLIFNNFSHVGTEGRFCKAQNKKRILQPTDFLSDPLTCSCLFNTISLVIKTLAFI